MEEVIEFFKGNLIYCLVPVVGLLVVFFMIVLFTTLSKNKTMSKELEYLKSKNTMRADEENEHDEMDSLDASLVPDTNLPEGSFSTEEDREEINAKMDKDLSDSEKIVAELMEKDNDSQTFSSIIPDINIGDGKYSPEDKEFLRSMEDESVNYTSDDIDKMITESHNSTYNEIAEMSDEIDRLFAEVEDDDNKQSDNNAEKKEENITKPEQKNPTDEEIDESENEEDESGIKYLVYFDNSIKKWIVRREDAVRASKKFNTRAEAIEHAGVLTSRYGGTIVKLRKNGVDNKR